MQKSVMLRLAFSAAFERPTLIELVSAETVEAKRFLVDEVLSFR